MHIVKKNISGKDYYYLNKSVRDGDKVKTEHVAYLGADKKEAEKKAEKIIEAENNKVNREVIEEKNMEEKEIDIEKASSDLTIEEMMNFCKKKGFVYPSGEIYGGLGGFWDFGHLGVELLNNLKKEWWKFHVQQRDDIVGIDGAIITNPKVWEASGHVSSFVDVAVVC